MGNKGARAERELFSKLWGKGLGVMRSPASGSRRKESQPDILASDGRRVLALELKSTGELPVYIGKDEVEKLYEFCERFGSVPLIGVRVDHDGWHFYRPKNCIQTENNYKVDEGLTEVELLG